MILVGLVMVKKLKISKFNTNFLITYYVRALIIKIYLLEVDYVYLSHTIKRERDRIYFTLMLQKYTCCELYALNFRCI